jgi:C_GCAxxG_C_C family probable redox protein
MDYTSIRLINNNEIQSVKDLLSECNLPTTDIEIGKQIFYGIFSNDLLLGCIGFEHYGADALLRSLAVRKEYRGKGLGIALYNKTTDHCLHSGITSLFLLTTTAEKFFNKLGWIKCERSFVPDDVKQSQEFANICPSSAVCMNLNVFTSSKDYSVKIFNAGFNCAQSVFVPYAINKGMTAENAFKMATGFGAGMVYRGETCGAVTGAMMAIGLNYGRKNAVDTGSRDKTYTLINEFYAKFKEKHGTIICKELLKYDISIPENRELVFKAGLFDTLCPKLVEDASALVEELMSEKVT